MDFGLQLAELPATTLLDASRDAAQQGYAAVYVPDTLITLAGLGVAIAGFSGVAVALDQRLDAWPVTHKSLFHNLIIQSFSVLGWSLLALILMHWEVDPGILWPGLSSGLVVASVATNAWFWGDIRKGKDWSRLLAPLLETTILCALVGLQTLAFTRGELAPAPFLTGLAYLVGSAAVAFIRLLFAGPLRVGKPS
jgi:hypothetical protein